MTIKHLFQITKFSFFMITMVIAGHTLAASEQAKKTVNFSEIINFANFASAAYQTNPTIQQISALKNYTMTHYRNIPGLEISYFLATDNINKSHVIAVRGTANIENTLIDLAVELTSDKITDVRLHNGFSQSARAIYQDVKTLLNPDYAISTTGHSLGGAVALILAMYLDMDGLEIEQVVTFGQPKVTNIEGSNKFKHLNITRVVTENDLVPLVPPVDPVNFNNIDIYWHPGREVILLQNNSYAILEGVESMLRAVKFTQQPLNENNLQNHQMTLYLEMLNKKIPHANLVPFESSFNLFNLFGK